jgi:thiazole synthase ThiGH ThiG subunit
MRIDLFKHHLEEKRAVKVIAGIDNFDMDSVKKVVSAAQGASAIDICADEHIISMVREMTDLPLFVSSVVPQELARAVELGADAVELGNYDALYKKGMSFSAAEVLELARETKSLVGDTFMCVTIPGELSVNEQISLARNIEMLGVDLIQTEGHFSAQPSEGIRGLMERAQLTISNTMELCANLEMPVMSATGINTTTAPFAFTAGASAIGIGSCVNKLDNELSMRAVINQVIEIAQRNVQKTMQLI